MPDIQCRRDGELAIIELARGKANALNAAMVDELLAATGAAAADASVRGIVLASARPRFFSGGFDLEEVFSYDPAKMTEFFGHFIDLYELLLAAPKPVIAAVSGHAVAGGAVLSLACDFRVMAQGDFHFALNEVALGVVLPEGVHRMVFHAVGTQHAASLLLAGEAIRPQRAYEIGLAAELAAPEQVLPRAISRARALAAKPASAYAAIKRMLRASAGDRQCLPRFIEQWFSPESVASRRALAEKVKAPAP
jgi:enoyl-CoA hydratase/carnithine racemase